MRARSGTWLFLRGLVAAAVLVLAGCGDDDGRDDRFQALSLNMYIGFGQDVLSGDLTDPDRLAAALQRALATFQQTDAQARIGAMARFIAAEQPDVVGLQEVVAVILTRGTPDTSDDAAFIDFLEDLQEGIQRGAGLRYRAFVNVNNVLEGRLNILGRLEPFRLTEADVVLVHPDLQAQQIGTGLSFMARMPIGRVWTEQGLVERRLVRGAQHVRVTKRGRGVDVFNTHLEIFGEMGEGLPFQEAQAAELVDYIATQTAGAADRDVVLIGDMNNVSGSLTHSLLTGAGLVDTFAAAGAGAGLTCCQSGDLSNVQSTATVRIDYVFFRPGSGAALELRESRVVLDSRVPRSVGTGQVWPSDHFAVLAEFALP
jgi:endonuclease/exonuclease/phosphatase family metal-dependent hydrolase